MGKSNNDPPGHFVTFSAANQIREAVTTKYRGFGEKHMLPPRIFKRWESHPQSKWFKFQASCCFNYKFLVLIVCGIFRTIFFACDVWSLLKSLCCDIWDDGKINTQVLVPKLGHTLESTGTLLIRYMGVVWVAKLFFIFIYLSLLKWNIVNLGFPGGLMVKNPPVNEGDTFVPWVRKFPWRKKWQPTIVFLSGRSHGQREEPGGL